MIPEALEDSPRIQSDRAASASFPAPTKGWDTVDPLPAMPQGYAVTLDNWIPRQYYLEGRGGQTSLRTLSSNVAALIAHSTVTGQELLVATTDGGLAWIDTSSGAINHIPFDFGGFSPGLPIHYVNFAIPGGNYVFITDSSFSVYGYSGIGGTSLVHTYFPLGGATALTVAAIKQRLWFTSTGLDVYFCDTLSLPTVAGTFPLGGIFKLGGQTVAIASWSIDGGSGLDDYNIFITSEGEIAVYTGYDPTASVTEAGHFQLAGVYRIPKPIGHNCTVKYGGDLLILTVAGPYLLSKALVSADVSQEAVLSPKIANTFSSLSANYTLPGWQMELLPQENLLIINSPAATGAVQFVMNTLNGAWARFTGMNLSAICELNGVMYGANGAKVVKLLQNGSNDLGSLIAASLVVAYSKLGAPGRNKHVKMVKPTIEVSGNVLAEMAELTDYGTRPTWYSVGNLPVVGGSSFWGTGKWGSALWSEPEVLHNLWYTIPHSPGRALAWGLRCTYGTANMVKLSAYDLVYEVGGVM